MTIRKTAIAALHGLAAWAVAAAVMSVASWYASVSIAGVATHAVALPLACGLASLVYFRREDALHPLAAAATFAVLVLALDTATHALFRRSSDVVLAIWLPVCAAFLVTWITGLAFTCERARVQA
jgi:hypothetical protein